MFLDNLVLIDLSKFKNEKEFKKVLEDNDYPSEKISPKVLLKLKKEGFIKIFFDKKEFTIIAVSHESSDEAIILSDEIIWAMHGIVSIDFKNEDNKIQTNEKNRIQNTNNTKLDDILDKINSFGINSLTQDEKDFLNSASKL